MISALGTRLMFLCLLIVIVYGQTEKTAGVGLAVAIADLFGYSLMKGVIEPITILTADAFVQSDMRKCGILLNRSLCITTVCFAPLAAVLTLQRPVLLWLGQEPRVVE